ncbi:hypothetical protein Tco_0790751 [Tanacetum coccineum]
MLRNMSHTMRLKLMSPNTFLKEVSDNLLFVKTSSFIRAQDNIPNTFPHEVSPKFLDVDMDIFPKESTYVSPTFDICADFSPSIIIGPHKNQHLTSNGYLPHILPKLNVDDDGMKKSIGLDFSYHKAWKCKEKAISLVRVQDCTFKSCSFRRATATSNTATAMGMARSIRLEMAFAMLAGDIIRKITRLWDITYIEADSYEDWLNWLVNLRLSSNYKQALEDVVREFEGFRVDKGFHVDNVKCGSKFNEIGTRPLLNDAFDAFDK